MDKKTVPIANSEIASEDIPINNGSQAKGSKVKNTIVTKDHRLVSRKNRSQKAIKRCNIPKINERGGTDAAQITKRMVSPFIGTEIVDSDTEYHIIMGHPCTDNNGGGHRTTVDPCEIYSNANKSDRGKFSVMAVSESVIDKTSAADRATGISDVEAELSAAFERAKCDKEDTISINIFYDGSKSTQVNSSEIAKHAVSQSKRTSEKTSTETSYTTAVNSMETADVDEKSASNAKGIPMDTSDTEEVNVDSISCIPEQSTSQATIPITVRPDKHTLVKELEARTARAASEPEVYSRIRKRVMVDVYAEDTGPHLYNVTGNVVTRPIVPNKLPQVFEYLPIFGRPSPKMSIEEFQNNKIRDFIGSDIDDKEFESLGNYCSPEHLRTGTELVMSTSIPTPGTVHDIDMCAIRAPAQDKQTVSYEPCIVKKCRMRMDQDPNNQYITKLKYRGMRMTPIVREEDLEDTEKNLLEPGRDILLRVRIYRPFNYNKADKPNSKRHSLFNRDMILAGTQLMSEMRDRFLCPNDMDLRVDVSLCPNKPPPTSAKELFPSGFMFINNVFYVDDRAGCHDTSAVVRAWAAARGLGRFQTARMARTRLQDIVLRLGHPEVYVHQGNCEHLFTFSEIRLVGPTDALRPSYYPCHTATSPNHTVYCTTCAEFGAKWLVTGCDRVPFDPAFFCDQCLRQYLYKNDQKVGDFQAYSYVGNEFNVSKGL